MRRKVRENKTFYDLLKASGDLHTLKANEYSGDADPYANFKFAGQMSKLFVDPDDSGFVGRIAERLFRLANLENSGKTPQNEPIEDTERELCMLVVLWMSMRKDRRRGQVAAQSINDNVT
jgi:hypothetical protein